MTRQIRFHYFLLAATCAAIQAAPRVARETVFTLDPARTEVKFALHATLHTVHGTFQLKHGSMRLDFDTGKAGGEIVVDTPSAKTGNSTRDRTMHQEVLESELYPEAVFIPDHVEGHVLPEGKSELKIHGMLKLHGTEHAMTLPVEVEADGGKYVASTHFTVPYVEWGMKKPNKPLLRVGETVEVEVRAETGVR